MKNILKLFGFAVILSATTSFAEDTAATPKADTAQPKTGYVQHNFVANNEKYKADVVEKDLINAWGISIRPAGAGGHFWVTAKDVSYEYVGDVQNAEDEKLRKLHTDDLKYVKLPVGNKDAFATGTVFNGSDKNFVITQKVKGVADITAPAKFLFASDGGVISAWTERKKEDGTKDMPSDAIKVIDESKSGAAFFGLAISSNYDRIYVADFGEKPAIKVYGPDFKPANIVFDTPFDYNKNNLVDAGEYAPFNVQALKTPAGEARIFVTYAKTQECPEEKVQTKECEKGGLFVAEEDASVVGNGRIAEFTEEGKIVAVWNDDGKLSAPWGFAFAPDNFGALSGTLLVSNFGDGTIAAYDPKTKHFVDYVKNEKGEPIVIKGIWGILFGNGASLGDSNALYFAAGPDDEKDGVFGSIRPVK